MMTLVTMIVRTTKAVVRRQLVSHHDRIARRFALDSEGEFYRALLTHYARGADYCRAFDFASFKSETLDFIKLHRAEGQCLFKFANSTAQPNVYSAAFAFLTTSVLGGLHTLDKKAVDEWAAYFNRFQSERDGLFRDPVVANDIFEDSDWWGARHLALILVACYEQLKRCPPSDFHFLSQYYKAGTINSWLEELDWSLSGDDDNKIMNIGGLLQFSRDRFANRSAGHAISELQEGLLTRINPNTGLWGSGVFNNERDLSRAVQFAYHLYPILLYDNHRIPYPESLIDCVLKTQNELGGYAPHCNSSACEDIDSLYLLVRAAECCNYRTADIQTSVSRYLIWVFANRNRDGGFVFKRGTSFQYGHAEMRSEADESHMFAVWFRSLSIAMAMRFLHGRECGFTLGSAPGYYA